MIRNKFLNVVMLIFISVLALATMQVTMTPMDTTTLVARVLGICAVSMILYVLVSKIGSPIHINRKIEIVFAAAISMIFIVLSVLNLSQMHNDIGRLEHDKFIHLGNFGVDKYYLASTVVLIVFPMFALLITGIMQKRRRGVLISGIILWCTQVVVIMSLCGLRLASIGIVAIINTIVTCYVLKTKFKISKRKLLFIIAGFGLVLITVFLIYNNLYPKNMEISIRHFWKIIPWEMWESIFKNSKFIGMNIGEVFSAPDVFYDCFNPLIVMLLEFGLVPFIIMLLLSVVMIYLIVKIVRTIYKSEVSDIKKIIAVALTSHILLQITMSILISLGVPAIPIHFPFYIQEEIWNYHFRYTTSGYADIVILTCLIMIYLEASKKKETEEKAVVQRESEVDENETVCV